MGTPQSLRPAVELLCTSENVRDVDVVQMGDIVFILRLYVGIEPEQQTSREDKDRYGKLAYVVDAYRKARDSKEVNYRITLDGDLFEIPAMVLYVVNAAKNGAGVSVAGDLSKIDDGLMDAFILNMNDLNTISGAVDRMLNLDTSNAQRHMRQGKEMTIADNAKSRAGSAVHCRPLKNLICFTGLSTSYRPRFVFSMRRSWGVSGFLRLRTNCGWVVRQSIVETMRIFCNKILRPLSTYGMKKKMRQAFMTGTASPTCSAKCPM
jgi:hypothetical protein